MSSVGHLGGKTDFYAGLSSKAEEPEEQEMILLSCEAVNCDFELLVKVSDRRSFICRDCWEFERKVSKLRHVPALPERPK